MTDANTIREAIRSTYRARVRGDLDGTVALFADDAVFDFNGQGVGLPNMGTAVRGKPAIRLLMTEFIDAFRMSDWQEVSLVVEGDKAALHWERAVTFTQNGKSEKFDVFDLLAFPGTGRSSTSGKARTQRRYARCSELDEQLVARRSTETKRSGYPE